MRHLLMDPAFPDIVGAWAVDLIDDRARVWTVTMGPDGLLEDCLDPGLLADAMVIAAGEQEIAATRLW
jgi:hypothetical protein